MLFRYIWSLKALIISLIIIFFLIFIPETDIYISSKFFENSFFIDKDRWHIHFINDFLLIFAALILVIIIIYSLLYSAFIKKSKKLFLCYLIYASIMFAGIHGLVVHNFAKNEFGRPRPLQIKEFGGKLSFVRAFEFSDQCKSNCSFVSGDVSMMFTTFMISLMIPLSQFITIRRKFFLANLLFCLGLFMCFCRVSLGKHFFSDAICAMIIVIGSGLGFYRLIFGKQEYQNLKQSLLS